MPPLRMWINDNAAADRRAGRWTPKDETVTFEDNDRLHQCNLNPGGFAGGKRIMIEQAHRSQDFRRPDEEFNFGVVLERQFDVREMAKAGIEEGGGAKLARQR